MNKAAQIIKPLYDESTTRVHDVIENDVFGEDRKKVFAAHDAVKAIYAYATPGNQAVVRTFEDVVDFAKGYIEECEEDDDWNAVIERNVMQNILDLLLAAL